MAEPLAAPVRSIPFREAQYEQSDRSQPLRQRPGVVRAVVDAPVPADVPAVVWRGRMPDRFVGRGRGREGGGDSASRSKGPQRFAGGRAMLGPRLRSREVGGRSVRSTSRPRARLLPPGAARGKRRHHRRPAAPACTSRARERPRHPRRRRLGLPLRYPRNTSG